MMKMSGVKALHQLPGHNFFSSTGLVPTLEVSGIQSGYTGIGFQNIVPGTADARLNLRTVQGQKTSDVLKLVTKFIRNNIPGYVDYTLDYEDHGDPIVLDTDSDYGLIAQKILEQIHKKPVIKNTSGD